MDISIREAAAILQKSQRTVRHMAQTGRIPARRIGSRWLLKREDVVAIRDGKPVDEEVAEAPEETSAIEEETTAQESAPRPAFTVDFGEALHQIPHRPGHAARSVRELGSFGILTSLLGELAASRRGPCEPNLLDEVERSLRNVLEILADGLHRTGTELRVERFLQAQSQACAALTGLLHYNMIYAEPDLSGVANRIEHELIHSIQELIDDIERRSRWRGRAITAAESMVDRVCTQVRAIAGEGKFSARVSVVQDRIQQVLTAAL